MERVWIIVIKITGKILSNDENAPVSLNNWSER